MGFIEDRKAMAKKMLKEGNEHIGNRMTGRSTALALKIISEAMLNRGSSIKIKDEAGTQQADRMLANYIMDRILQMKLEGLTIDMRSMTLTYSLL